MHIWNIYSGIIDSSTVCQELAYEGLALIMMPITYELLTMGWMLCKMLNINLSSHYATTER